MKRFPHFYKIKQTPGFTRSNSSGSQEPPVRLVCPYSSFLISLASHSSLDSASKHGPSQVCWAFSTFKLLYTWSWHFHLQRHGKKPTAGCHEESEEKERGGQNSCTETTQAAWCLAKSAFSSIFCESRTLDPHHRAWMWYNQRIN